MSPSSKQQARGVAAGSATETAAPAAVWDTIYTSASHTNNTITFLSHAFPW